MTREEFVNLDFTKIYEFTFYYGDVIVGILNDQPARNKPTYFFIQANKIHEFNTGRSINENIGKGIMTKINIDTIVKWKPINI